MKFSSLDKSFNLFEAVFIISVPLISSYPTFKIETLGFMLGNKDLKRVVSLGYQPLANNLLNKEKDKCELYPLEVNYCE